ncbi:MAG: phosphatidate cytidylyltransferase [Oscillospiraceae bacterium]|nr:phosphatidate cytidylyltransferase [Oscillospiraceae bacterium]
MLIRSISAAIGIVVAIGVLFLHDTPVYDAVVAALSVIMVYELLSANKCIKHKLQSGVCFLFAAVMPFLSEYSNEMELKYILAAVCIFTMFAGFIAKHKEMTFEKLCYMIAVTILASTCMCCLVALKNLDDVHGVCYIVLCLAGAWLGDSGAYFAGTFLGKHKLCPEISPKKTVEGAVGGVITVGIVFAVYAFFYHMVQEYRGFVFEVNYPYLVIMGLICGILGIVGDLSASLVKRQCGIKDFGNIMPGHGGLMDRFDSVLFVAPFMMFVLSHFTLFK